MQVKRGSKGHADACMDIARDLRDHFDDNAMKRMPVDLRDHRLYVAMEDGVVVGFLTLVRRDEGIAEITWMGVRRDRWRGGIGTALVELAARDLASEGLELLEVRTLADTVDYAPYEATRAFYRALGFTHRETRDPYPEWGTGSPCAIYGAAPWMIARTLSSRGASSSSGRRTPG